MEPPITPAPEEPKKNNTILYIAIAAVILCCCCVGAFIFYQYLGDPLVEAIRNLLGQ
jgi:hypothetical protein